MKIYSLAIALALVNFAGGLSADEVVIKVEDTPQPIVAAIEKVNPGGKIVRAEKQMDKDAKDGKLSYEMNVDNDGKHFQYIFSPEGKVYERRDINLTLADVPDAVRQVVIKETNGAEPQAMEKSIPTGGNPHYKFRAAKGQPVFDVTPEGQIISKK